MEKCPANISSQDKSQNAWKNYVKLILPKFSHDYQQDKPQMHETKFTTTQL